MPRLTFCVFKLKVFKLVNPKYLYLKNVKSIVTFKQKLKIKMKLLKLTPFIFNMITIPLLSNANQPKVCLILSRYRYKEELFHVIHTIPHC